MYFRETVSLDPHYPLAVGHGYSSGEIAMRDQLIYFLTKTILENPAIADWWRAEGEQFKKRFIARVSVMSEAELIRFSRKVGEAYYYGPSQYGYWPFLCDIAREITD